MKGTEFDLPFKRSPIARVLITYPVYLVSPLFFTKKKLIILGMDTKLPDLPNDGHPTQFYPTN